MKSTLKTYLQSHAFQLVVALGSALAALAGIMPAEAGWLPLLLLHTDPGDVSGGASGIPNDPPANGGGQAAPAAGEAGKPAPASAPAAAPDKKDSGAPRQKAALAADRAATKLAAAKAGKAGKPNSSSDASAQHAPAGDPAGGVSPAAKPGAGEQAAPPGGAEPGEEKPKPGDAPAATTAPAPDNWGADRKAKFDALPTEAKAVILDFHKDMSAGLNHAFTQLSDERTRHQDVFALDDKFRTGPEGAKEVIGELAQRAGLEIFFERPLPEGELPEEALKDPAKLAKHIEDRVVQRTQQLTAKASTEREQKTRTEQAQAQLTREFQDAATAHTDFVTHKPAVHQLLQKAPSLSVEEAYRLATHEALVKRVNEGETAKRELATAKAELERLKKNATQLPAGAGAGSATGEDKFMSPAERSYARATTKRTARGAPA